MVRFPNAKAVGLTTAFALVVSTMAVAVRMGLPIPLGPARTPAATSDVKDVLKTYLNESWTWTGPGTGGYGSIGNLAGTPSLYRSAWMTRVGALLGIREPGLVPGRAQPWLVEVARTGSDSGGLPPLENACLAAGALSDLGVGLGPQVLAQDLDGWRLGSQFRWSQEQPVSLSATARAVLVLAHESTPIPADVRAGILRSLQTPGFDPFFSGNLGETLSFWQVADTVLSRTERAPYQSTLRRALSAALTQANGHDGPALGTLVSLQEIGTDNSISLNVVVPNLASDIAPDGLVKLSQQASASDPQTTEFAVLLGWRPADLGISAIAESAGPRGWPKPLLATPEASYFGLVLAHMLGMNDRDAALVQQTKAWLAGSRLDMRSTYFEIALARVLGLDVPGDLLGSLKNSIQTITVGDSAALNLVAIAGLIGAKAPVGSEPGSLRMCTFDSVPNAYEAWLWGIASGDAGSRQCAGQYLQERRDDSGALSIAKGQPADLFSTAAYHRVLAAPPDRQVVLRFVDDDGYWHFPPGASPNQVDLQGFYLAAYIAGQVSDPAGVF